MTAQGEPTREEVLAWVDAHPSPTVASDCVKHFTSKGRPIDGGKIRVWLTRRRAVTGATPTPPPVVAPDKPPPTPTGKWAGVLDSGEEGRSAASAPAGRARATLPKPVQKLAPAMKQQIRDAAEGFAAFLATAKDCAIEVEVIKKNPNGSGGQLRVLDMQQYLNASKALAQIMELAKGTDAFDSDTGGVDEETNDEAAQLAEAFGLRR